MKAKMTNWAKWVPKKAKEVLSRQNPDGTVSVLHLDNEDNVFSIDGIAIEVWTMINGRTSLKTIQTILEEKYSAPSKQITRDLKSFMGQLSKEKLLDG